MTLAERGRASSSARPAACKCSSQLETSVPGIFAAGDICEYDSVIHGKPMRIEHWDVAFNQGKTAALNMLGRERRPRRRALLLLGPRRLERRWSTSARARATPVIRGSLDDGDFTAFYVDDGQGHGGADGGPLGRPRARQALHHGGRGAGPRRRWRTSRRTWACSAEPVELRGRDSNPDNQLQRLASCH